MSPKAEALLPKLELLSREDKEEIISYLEGADGDLHPDWEAEIDRRMEDIETGREKGIPMDVVMARLRARFPSYGSVLSLKELIATFPDLYISLKGELEAFFEAKFGPLEIGDNEECELWRPSGDMHWRIWFGERDKWLQIAVHNQPCPSGHTLLELSIQFEGFETHNIPGTGQCLNIHVSGTGEEQSIVRITKLYDGQLSLATCVGHRVVG